MRSALASVAVRRSTRKRSTSLSAIPPSRNSTDYLPELAAIAASILYKSPAPSQNGHPIYIVNAAAFPDSFDIDYDSLLPYVLARLPSEEELIAGQEYEVIFFAGGQPEGATTEKKQGPGMGWYLAAYHILGRATRKKLQQLYIVHPPTWVRVLVGVFGTVVSPKFRRKIVHIATLSQLASHIQVERLLIPPAVYLHDRKLTPDADVLYVSGRRAFGASNPLPRNLDTGKTRLPRLLRETTGFLLQPGCVRMEGLFRIPPHAVLASALKEAYDRGQSFIVWKEKSASLVQPGMDRALCDEVRLEDAYGVHLAATLIKTWYRELRDPIFPESSYAQLRQRFDQPDPQVTLEDLVDLLLPGSAKSPLLPNSREILTRHLLPMLSEVSKHEEHNKMNAENLAICFAMALVCGSNQLEDARMTTVIRKILEPAIKSWPELQEGMGIGDTDFHNDLQPPSDSRDYEDPLDERPMYRMYAEEQTEAHRIQLSDADDSSKSSFPAAQEIDIVSRPAAQEMDILSRPAAQVIGIVSRPPALPPRPPRSRPISPRRPSPRPSPRTARSRPVSPRPVSPCRTSPRLARSRTVSNGAATEMPRRKPTPTLTQPSLTPARTSLTPVKKSSPPLATTSSSPAPPRFSGLFQHPNSPIVVRETPPAADVSRGIPSLHRRSQSEITAQENAKKGYPVPTITEIHPALTTVPRRKAILSETSAIQTHIARSASVKTSSPPPLPPKFGPPEPVPAHDHIFAKPTWPASSRPPLPARPPPLPIASTPSPSFVPRHRTPSPGLLKRLGSFEPSGWNGSTWSGDLEGNGDGSGRDGLLFGERRRLELSKESVDDLRRLYEERAGIGEVLGRRVRG